MVDTFLRQLGIGVASLTFGVALSIFIFAAATGLITGLQTLLLFVTSFLLMLRFWWRYSELFIKFLPSKGYWHFLLDFAVSFFGIIAVLLISNIQLWATVGAAAMIASAIRCALSWKDAKNAKVRKMLKRTLWGSVVIFIIFLLVYYTSQMFDNLIVSAAILVIILIFIAYASKKP